VGNEQIEIVDGHARIRERLLDRVHDDLHGELEHGSPFHLQEVGAVGNGFRRGRASRSTTRDLEQLGSRAIGAHLVGKQSGWLVRCFQQHGAGTVAE
jgi:hypothetical protein